jgi:hypothetical protein
MIIAPAKAINFQLLLKKMKSQMIIEIIAGTGNQGIV